MEMKPQGRKRQGLLLSLPCRPLVLGNPQQTRISPFPQRRRRKTNFPFYQLIGFQDRASSSRSKHEGESSNALCDRLSRTRATSQRQLPTDHDHATRLANIRLINRRLFLPRLLLALSWEKQRMKKLNKTDPRNLTRSLHIRAMPRHPVAEQWI
jgi:hypothetical protein